MRLLTFLCLVFACQNLVAQKSLSDYIKEAPKQNVHYESSCYDLAGKEQGININSETHILKQLGLEKLEHAEYYITGKYAVNNLWLVFFSKYHENEDIHFAFLFDENFKLIDKLNETAYSSSGGSHKVSSRIEYNTVSLHAYETSMREAKRYTITKKGFKPIREGLKVTAPSGVRLRKAPTLNSDIIATLPTNTHVEYIVYCTSGSVKDNGDYISGNWLEVAYTKDGVRQVGFLFDAFAKKQILIETDEHSIVINSIKAREFNRAKQQEIPVQPIVEITDIEEIKKLLGNQLELNYQGEEDYSTIKIIADNGKVFKGEPMSECFIASYFPDYHYILLECGHSSDHVISLKDGNDQTEILGNPDYYLPSPDGSFRLNGYYTGQSDSYFLEKRIENKSQYLLPFDALLALDFIDEKFWVDEHTLYLSAAPNYYQLVIK